MEKRLRYLRVKMRGQVTITMESSKRCERGHSMVCSLSDGKLIEWCSSCQTK